MTRSLLVTPLWPAATGNGLAMRCGVWLEALAAGSDVTLWVVPVAAGGTSQPRATTSEAAAQVVVAPLVEDPAWALARALRDPLAAQSALREMPQPELARFATSEAIARLRDAAGAAPFDTVVAVRSYVGPFAAPLVASSPAGSARAVLDLDDDEAATRRSLAALHRAHGDERGAAAEELEAWRFAALERRLAPSFSILTAAHPGHVEALRRRHPGRRAEPVPNAVALPPAPVERPLSERREAPAGSPSPGAATPGGGEELRVLFVGNLGYLPNVDAACWLAGGILPLLRAGGARRARLRIVGSGPAARVLALSAEDVAVVADAADLAPHYAWAQVVAAPLRAGGGTRIKVLEAFAHGVPVVATALAADGLGAVPGSDLLVADEAATFAAACVAVATDRLLARRLRLGARLVAERHARPRVIARIHELLATER